MIKITILNNIEPVDLGTPNRLDKNELFERKIYLFGLKVWHYKYDRAIDVKTFVKPRPTKAGF